jgi:hypothetical protein
MSEEGLGWLRNILDPFHDTLVTPEGFPDVSTAPCVVQRIKLPFTVAAPTGYGGVWDCQVFLPPVMNTQQMIQPATTTFPITQNLCLVNLTQPQWAYGGLMIITAPTKQTMALQACATGGATTGWSLTSNPIPQVYWTGSCRAVAAAFEIVNTTPLLTVGGAITTYRQAVPDYETATATQFAYNGSNPTPYGVASTIIVPHPPLNNAECMLLPGSRKWNAKDGCYVVATLNSDQIPIQDELFTAPIITNNTPSGAIIYYPVTSTATFGTIQTMIFQDNFWTKFNQCGAFLSGLSNSTTLDVTLIMDIQRFPTVSQSDIIVNARPPAKYDPVAIEAYGLIAQTLPTGVEQKENGLGDWIMGAVKNVASFVAPIIQRGVASHPKMQVAHAAYDAFNSQPTQSHDYNQHFLAPSGGTVGKVYQPNQKQNMKQAPPLPRNPPKPRTTTTTTVVKK